MNSEVSTLINTSQRISGDHQAVRRKRKSKKILDGRNYRCECGKAYLSQPALNNHKNTKHPMERKQEERRGRGRPRKYIPEQKEMIETPLMDTFFTESMSRKRLEHEEISLPYVIKEVFNDIYLKNYDRCYSHPRHYTDNPVLQMLFNEKPSSADPKTCDDILFEYLYQVKNLTNQNYFKLVLKFIILYRECLNMVRSPENEKLEGQERFDKTAHCSLGALREYSNKHDASLLPDLANDFVTEFLEGNNYFGISSETDGHEIIMLIQHFCHWLFKSGYTSSKLSFMN